MNLAWGDISGVCGVSFRGLRAMFGDQNLFCRSSDFQKVGGYDQRIPIMEDLDLIMRLHAAGPSLSDPDLDKAPPSPHLGGSTTGTDPGESERYSGR